MTLAGAGGVQIDGRSAIWGGATLGLIVGVILGLFLGRFWSTLLYAVGGIQVT